MDEQISVLVGVLSAIITIGGAILVGLITWIVRSSEDRTKQYVQAQVGEVKEQLGEVKERLGAVESEVGEVKERLGRVESEVREGKERLGAVEVRLGRVEVEVGEGKERLGRVEVEVGEGKERLGRVESEVREGKERLGVVEAEVGGLKEQVQASEERIQQRIDRLEESNREENRVLTAEVQTLKVEMAGLNALAERNVARSVADLFARASRETESAPGKGRRLERIFAETPPEGEDPHR